MIIIFICFSIKPCLHILSPFLYQLKWAHKNGDIDGTCKQALRLETYIVRYKKGEMLWFHPFYVRAEDVFGGDDRRVVDLSSPLNLILYGSFGTIQ